MRPPLFVFAAVLGAFSLSGVAVRTSTQQPRSPGSVSGRAEKPSTIAAHLDPGVLFKTSDNCMACHNSLIAPSGEDVSIGTSWRASVMANSSRDPYWQAGVRRETLDHPSAAAEIQDECSICHMPMARTTAQANGRRGEVFAHLPVGTSSKPLDLLAYDGVSCTMCHQIANERLGTPESFVGGFVVAGRQAEARPIFGPFDVERGLTAIMRSSAEFQPTEGAHIRQSTLCATCHTLYTKALNPQGQVIGVLPEQVMYLEWKHSAFPGEEATCQSCHMPAVSEEMPIASVLGQPRKGLARHVFVGGNFFLLNILNKYRLDLAVEALPQELEVSALRTVRNLQTQTATVSIERAELTAGRLLIDLAVHNLTGHKLPTGYPARRVWLHVTVRGAGGRTIFESGAIAADGSVRGNDSDRNPAQFEPHYAEIRQPDEVQIYESVMSDPAGVPTTGLLTAVRYLKDNRLLPRGFDKRTAESDVRVVGEAVEDADFLDGGDRIRYAVDTGAAAAPFQVDVELRFQPIAFRWAQNLKAYDSAEARRFLSYYDSMASRSSEVLARTSTVVK